MTENETIASVNSWQQNLAFHIASCDDFAPFIEAEWKTKSVRNRGLTDDEEGATPKRTAAHKCTFLNHLHGLVVSYSPENIRLEIDRKATSLKWIWARVRRHYGFTKSEGLFLKLSNIKLEEGERYETFYQGIMSQLYDNLLTPDSGITFDGAAVTEDEVMSPTTERLAVYLWLTSIDCRLPMYVSRVYAHDLMSKSLKDLQSQICQNLDSLIHDSYPPRKRSKLTFPGAKAIIGFVGLHPIDSLTVRICHNTTEIMCLLQSLQETTYLDDITTCYHLSQFDRAEFSKAFHVSVG